MGNNNVKYNNIISKINTIHNLLFEAKDDLLKSSNNIARGVILNGEPHDKGILKLYCNSIEAMKDDLLLVKKYCNDNIVVNPPSNTTTVTIPSASNNGMHIGGNINSGNATTNGGVIKPSNSLVVGLGGNYGIGKR